MLLNRDKWIRIRNHRDGSSESRFSSFKDHKFRCLPPYSACVFCMIQGVVCAYNHGISLNVWPRSTLHRNLWKNYIWVGSFYIDLRGVWISIWLRCKPFDNYVIHILKNISYIVLLFRRLNYVQASKKPKKRLSVETMVPG